jgi:hypothetical protein
MAANATGSTIPRYQAGSIAQAAAKTCTRAPALGPTGSALALAATSESSRSSRRGAAALGEYLLADDDAELAGALLTQRCGLQAPR